MIFNIIVGGGARISHDFRGGSMRQIQRVSAKFRGLCVLNALHSKR